MSGGTSAFDFSCNVTHVGSIPTPNLVTDEQAAQLIAGGQINGLRKFRRDFFDSGKAIMPDGVEIQHWGYSDETGLKHLPSPQIRVLEGEVAQVTLTTGKRVHTIHHHGIEPDPFNDGVGHTSFEVSGSYVPTSGVRPRREATGTTATSTLCCTCRWACSGHWSSTRSRTRTRSASSGTAPSTSSSATGCPTRSTRAGTRSTMPQGSAATTSA